MKKINWFFFVPASMLVVSPWVHKLLYMNLMAADLGISSDAAHFAIVAASLAAIFATCMMAI